MSVSSLKCIHKYITYRFTTTTIINQCLRYSSSLPIPRKNAPNISVSPTNSNIDHKRSSTPSSQAYAPWQQRTITLQDQSYRLPDLITARIESISNAKIETFTTKTQQKDIGSDTNQLEIVGDTSLLSSFSPSQYFQIKITGDANAVDVALQIYIYYTQNALPICTEFNIPDYVLDVISRDCGCFIEKQNAFVYRIYPTTLDKENDKEIVHKIERQIRSSIHRLNVAQPWFDNSYLMRLLFKYLRKQSKKHNLSFLSGGYFWFSETKGTENDDDDDDEEEHNIGYIWCYQNSKSKAIADTAKALQTHVDEYTAKWKFIPLSSKTMGVLIAKKKELMNYIEKMAKETYNIDCIMSRDSIAYRCFDECLFEDALRGILDHIVNIEINIELTDNERKDLHKICHDFNLIYLIPENEAFISYYYNSYYIGQQNKNKNELISKAIRSIIDPMYIPQQNIMTKRAKSDQSIRIENSEKFHVVIRMLQYLTQHRSDIKDIKHLKEDNKRLMEPVLYYSIVHKERAIELTVEREEGNDAVRDTLDSKIALIYDYINSVHSVSVPIPILFMLRGMALGNSFVDGIEAKLNVMMSFPPISADIGHIIQQHSQQKRLLRDKKNHITAKVYFWCKNNQDYRNIYHHFDNIFYKSVDTPIPIDLLHKSNNNKESKIRQVCTYYASKYGLLSFVKHPMNKYLKQYNPVTYNYRYWIFAERENKCNVDECIKDINKSVDECRFVDLKDVSSLIYYLDIVPSLQKKYKLGIKTSLNTGSGKLFCYDYDDCDVLESFCIDLEQKISDIKQNHCITIPGNKYEDIALFYVASNFKRIQKVIKTKSGFLWLNKAEETLNIYCDENEILSNIQSNVIQNIYQNSKILYWNKDFGVDYDSYLSSNYLQQQLKFIMKQTQTDYAIKSDKSISTIIAITNYDKYELDVCCNKLLRLLDVNADLNTPQHHALPKPIILS